MVRISLALALLLSACEKPATTSDNRALERKQDEQPAEDTTDQKVTSTKIGAGSTETQTLTAREGSSIAGANASFPPGSFSSETEISLAQGTDVGTSDFLTKLSLTSDAIANAAAAVSITASPGTVANQDFSLSLPMPVAAALSLQDETFGNLAIVFTGNGGIAGIIGRAQIELVNGFAVIRTRQFGTFQAVMMKNKSDAEKSVTIDAESPAVVVSQAPLMVTPGDLAYEVAVAAPETIFANTGSAVSLCAVSPALPVGLTITAKNNSCAISGTPQQALAQTSFTVTGSTAANISQNLVVKITVATAPPPAQVFDLPAALSFVDSDGDSGEVGGSLEITKAVNESLVVSYQIYYGDAARNVLGDANQPLATLAKTGSNLNYAVAADTVIPVGAQYFLVFTRNATGQSPGSLSIAIIDRVLPTGAPGALTFSDTDISTGEIAGNLNITMAGNEASLTSYSVYWGSSSSTKLGGANATPFATKAKTGAHIVHAIANNTALPAGVTHFLVYSTSVDGEFPSPASLSIVDSAVPTAAATGIAFTDADLDAGQLAGSVTIQKAANEGAIDTYVLYFGSNSTTKLGGVVATIAKTGSNVVHTFVADTVLPGAATHLLAFTANAFGEMATGVSVQIVDKQRPTQTAGSVSFTDGDLDVNQISGNVTIVKSASETTLSHYVLYFGSDATTKLGSEIVAFAKTGADLTYALSANTALPASASHLLVFTRNGMEEMLAGVSVSLTDRATPTAAAAGITFADADLDAGQLAGDVTIDMAGNENTVSNYILYFGSNATTKLGAAVATIAKTGSSLIHTFAADTPLPASATHLLVFTSNPDGEMVTGVNLLIVDKKIPTQTATSLSFVDGDLDGAQISGDVTIVKAADESDLTHYVLYFGSNASTKTGGEVASIAKTGSNVVHNFANNYPLPAGATHLLVFAKNADGEMASGVNIAIVDKAIPVNAAASVSFTDSDASNAEVSGTVTIVKAVAETDLTHYVLYWGSDATTKLGGAIVAVAKTGADVTHVFAANTSVPLGASYLLAFSKNASGEMATPTALAFTDVFNSAPTLTINQPSGGDDAVGAGASFSVNYTGADSDSVALIELYYRVGSGADCSAAGIGSWTSIVASRAEGTNVNYSWSPSVGTYFICGVIRDEVSEVYAVSSSSLIVNAAPTITITSPVGDLDESEVTVGQFNIAFTAVDSDSDATISLFYRVTGYGPTCNNSLTNWIAIPGAGALSENSVTSFAWTTNVAAGSYYICARISDGVNANVFAVSGKIEVKSAYYGGVKQVVTGNEHTCALLSNSELKCWGSNSNGQLGYNDTVNRGASAGDMGFSLPAVRVNGTQAVRFAAAGGNTTCAILDDGNLKCWGQNGSGRLGQGHSSDIGAVAGDMAALPAIDLGTGRLAISVAVGANHVCALLDNSQLKCWGVGGVIGLEDSVNKGDDINEMGDHLSSVNLGVGRKVIQVTAGNNFTCARLDNGMVKCWGLNGWGQLGHGNATHVGPNVGDMGDNLVATDLGTGRVALDINAGMNYACALLDNHTMKCWGINTSGELGIGATGNRGDGSGEMGDSLLIAAVGTGRKVVKIGGGAYHACAILDNGDLKCFGSGYRGALGLGTTTDMGKSAGTVGDNLPAVNLGSGRKARSIGTGHGETSCVILDDSSLKCFGNNSVGQVGVGSAQEFIGDEVGETGDGLSTVFLAADRSVQKIALGNDHSCSILDNGSTKCWGWGFYGVLGQGDGGNRGGGPSEMGTNLPALVFGSGREAVSLGLGGVNSCAILDDSSLKCWGSGTSGQLGLGNTENRGNAQALTTYGTVDLGTAKFATDVGVGYGHICAILDDSGVKCWGDNNNGKLGLGDEDARGDGAGEMGDTLPYVDLGVGRFARQIAGGSLHTCALLDNYKVKCWGSNTNGRAGLADGSVGAGAAANQMGDALPYVNLGADRIALKITTAIDHSCALLDNHEVKCWGANGSGQLGRGNTTAYGGSNGQMGDDLVAVDLGGSPVVAIQTASSHTCAILMNSDIKCWGLSDHGQIGQAASVTRGDGAGEMGSSLAVTDIGGKVQQLVSNGDHNCVVLASGKLKCWGRSNFGQLGLGSTGDKGTGPIAGDATVVNIE